MPPKRSATKVRMQAKAVTRRVAGAWWDTIIGTSGSKKLTPLIDVQSLVPEAYFMVCQVVQSGDIRTFYPVPLISSSGQDLSAAPGLSGTPFAAPGQWASGQGTEQKADSIYLVRPNHPDARKAAGGHVYVKSNDYEMVAYDGSQQKFFTCTLNGLANTFQITKNGIIAETSLNQALSTWNPAATPVPVPVPNPGSLMTDSIDMVTGVTTGLTGFSPDTATTTPPITAGSAKSMRPGRKAGALFADATPTIGVWNRSESARFDVYHGYTSKAKVPGASAGTSRVYDYTAGTSFELPSPSGSDADVVVYTPRLARKGLTIDREMMLIANDAGGIKSFTWISTSSSNAIYALSSAMSISDTIKDPKLAKRSYASSGTALTPLTGGWGAGMIQKRKAKSKAKGKSKGKSKAKGKGKGKTRKGGASLPQLHEEKEMVRCRKTGGAGSAKCHCDDENDSSSSSGSDSDS